MISIYKGNRRNGVRMAKRKRGMTFIPYDYEAAYNKSLEDMHEFFEIGRASCRERV